MLGLTEVSSVRGTNDFEEAGQVNPDIRAEVGINPESDLMPVTRVNGVTSVMVAPRGGSVGGTAALVHTRRLDRRGHDGQGAGRACSSNGRA